MVAPMEHVLPLAGWENFYVIIGSSAAALTGLQFVVVTLIGPELAKKSGTEINTFGTPTVVHFCSVLVVASIFSAPWHALSSAALALGISSAFGVAYAANTIRRARRSRNYHPVLEDWIWHAFLPLMAYCTLLMGSLLMQRDTADSLFFVAASSLLLLLVGIHNAWDSVVWIAVEQRRKEG
jgi:hypothetical protein